MTGFPEKENQSGWTIIEKVHKKNQLGR